MVSPRPELAAVRPATHGGAVPPDWKSEGPVRWFDFSVNTNPLGAPPGLTRLLTRSLLERYPEPDGWSARKALAAHLGLLPQQIVLGNGSVELIRLVAQAFLGPTDIAVIPVPAFGEYVPACQIAGARVVPVTLEEEDGFQIEPDRLVDAARRADARVLFLCNPNNPTGQLLPRGAVALLLSSLPESVVFVDEAYMSFAPDGWRSEDLLAAGNIVILRSLTKDWGLPGLRLGYALAPAPLADGLNRIRPPWNVNGLAQAAVPYLLGRQGHVDTGVELALAARDYLRAGFAALGYRVLPTDAHFFLVKVASATEFTRRLWRRGFLVRDCTSFGLPQYVRIAPQRLSACRALLRAVKELDLP
ncbi:MAG: histidinol-phosphate aminotransferase family protein [Chloroflexi bacterium]|nr:histidinol-phosphate aminotransferase family protein [Chloroflexota bacterium]